MTIGREHTAIEIATALLAASLPVVPLFAAGEAATPDDMKRPAIPWKEYQGRLPSADELATWFDHSPTRAARGVAVCTGRTGHVVVVDCDDDEAVAWADATLPPTPLSVKTAKGRHYYYRHPAEGEPGNSTRVLGRAPAPAVDIRGNGGYVVGPHSVHPTGAAYEPSAWPITAELLRSLPVYPYATIAAERERFAALQRGDAPAATSQATGRFKKTTAKTKPARPSHPNNASPDPFRRLSRATREFLEGGAVEPGRNQALFNATADMAGCGFTIDDAKRALHDAAFSMCRPPMERPEFHRTVESAFSEQRSPSRPASSPAARPVIDRSLGPATPTPPPGSTHVDDDGVAGSDAPRPTILVPGQHTVDGSLFEQSLYAFASQAIRALPSDSLYRRGRSVGQLLRGTEGYLSFLPATLQRVMLVADRHARFARGSYNPKTDTESIDFRTLSEPQARLIRDAAVDHGHLRALRGVTVAPVVIRRADGTLAPLPVGYDATSGWYRDARSSGDGNSAPSPPTPLDPNDSTTRESVAATFADLLVDFPFSTTADREAVVALLLTVILRPALPAVPLFLVEASMERSGKGKIACDLVGTLLYGRRIATDHIAGADEENEKRVMAWLRQARDYVVIDNLPPRRMLDSPVLASLATSETFSGRLLGGNDAPSYPNTMTLVLTGNNPRLHPELAKRAISIRLEPHTATPELRSDFVHPDLIAHLEDVRDDIVSTLHGMILGWQAAGRPHASTYRLGSFEEWAASVPAILHAFGMQSMFKQRAVRVARHSEDADDESHFVAAWWEEFGEADVELSKLLNLMHQTDTYQARLGDGEKNQLRVLGHILSEMTGRTVFVNPCPDVLPDAVPILARCTGVERKRVHNNRARYSSLKKV